VRSIRDIAQGAGIRDQFMGAGDQRPAMVFDEEAGARARSPGVS